jgi:hypothetical protein
MSNPYLQTDGVTLFHGDCLDVLRELPDESVHAVVTDPPYGLEFMGREWDGADGFRRSLDAADAGRDNVFGRASRTSPEYRAGSVFEEWCEAWARECLRILKPGGHLLAFGGSRTWHRLAAGIEDAGFEIRDSIAWLYGSGFPKSLDVGKALPDWKGWGTALKPAFEPIVVARKPLAGTVASNVLSHGTGALNIDANRVGDGSESQGARSPRETSSNDRYTDRGAVDLAATPGPRGGSPDGRWPANVVLDESQAAELYRQAPDTGGSGAASGPSLNGATGTSAAYGARNGVDSTPFYGGERGGASRMFPTFHYEAKAPTSERPVVDGVAHPTVKPLDLMRWLVRLVTPKGGIVLEPFAGSGTTVEACLREGFDVIAIEREADYLPLIEKRIRKDHAQGLDFDWGDAS